MPIEPSIDPSQLPPWAVFAISLYIILITYSKLRQVISEDIIPIFYNKARRRARELRHRFADSIESSIRRLNVQESWNDFRFTELEAEVEFEGKWSSIHWLTLIRRSGYGTRREQSLSRALAASRERLILVEGEPGSGKSVALRYIARKAAENARKAKTFKSIVPLYINLKYLERSSDNAIDRNLIESFVVSFLTRDKDRDVEEYLETEFRKGLHEGVWLFLFDSFDEIPEILSSTEADDVIKQYSEAITSFLHGMNTCRGVIASRHFRGPSQLGFTRFRILPLSEERKVALIRRMLLPVNVEARLRGDLSTARPEIQEMTKNPMFLGLLCQHVANGNTFPENTPEVFETYIQSRLTQDADRIRRRFGLDPLQIRLVAEHIAFVMTADTTIGLSPTRRQIQKALEKSNLDTPTQLNDILDALIFIKLGRAEVDISASGVEHTSFTFSHRRIQEYFATNTVIKNPGVIDWADLFSDARWRETAVVVLQTMNRKDLDKIFPVLKDKLQSFEDAVAKNLPDTTRANNTAITEPISFPWPSGLLHILGIIQDGFISRDNIIPKEIRLLCGQLINLAYNNGFLPDRKWALEVLGASDQDVGLSLLRDSIQNESQLLKDIAYRQTARIGKLPEDIRQWVRQGLIKLDRRGVLRKQRLTSIAFLSRLDQAQQFISVLNLLLWFRPINAALHIPLLAMLLALPKRSLPFFNFDNTILGDFSLLINELISSGLASQVIIIAAVLFSVSLVSILTVIDEQSTYFSIALMLPVAVSFRAMLLIGCALLATIPNTLWPLYLLIVIYISSWSHFACVAIYMGIFTERIYWPLLPVILPWQALINLPEIIPQAIRRIRHSEIFPLLLAGPAFVLLCIFPAGLIVESFPISEPIFTGLIALGMLFTALLTPFYLLFHLTRWVSKIIVEIKDFSHWTKFTTSLPNTLSTDTLMQSLANFRQARYKTKVLRLIIDKDLLEKTPQTITVLTELILEIEAHRRKARKDSVPEKDEKKTSVATVYSGLRKVDSEFLDLSTILLESIKAKSS